MTTVNMWPQMGLSKFISRQDSGFGVCQLNHSKSTDSFFFQTNATLKPEMGFGLNLVFTFET